METKPGKLTLGARTGAAAGMQADKKQIYMRIFQMIDKDGTGSLDHEELREALADLGEHLTEEDALDMIKENDKDGSGSREVDEFLQLIQARIKDEKLMDASQKAFLMFAEGSETSITQKEFMKIVAAAKKESNQFEIQTIMSELPWDEEGNLNIDEFISTVFQEL